MKNRPLISKVVHPSPVILPPGSIMCRIPPRPAEQRQSNYAELFDARTLFYDVFYTIEGITFSGPPLLNLKEAVDSAALIIDGEPTSDASFEDIDRTQRSYVRSSPGAAQFRIELGDFVAEVPVGANLSSDFAGRKVLLTKSKNNSLIWIEDWVRFHVTEHGVDAVLFYDNGSTAYTADDVLATIAGVGGVAVAVVVSWPFLFGPQGGSWSGLKDAPWDSDFCEYGILEHARRRFLAQAMAVVNADIDELVLTNDNLTIFEHLSRSKSGTLLYAGRWIETAGAPKIEPPRFSHFRYYKTGRASTTMKWTADPSRIRAATQWKTHYIHGVHMQKSDAVVHRHFIGITSNWKRKSEIAPSIDPEVHTEDSHLSEAMTRVFGPRMQIVSGALSLGRKLGSVIRSRHIR